MDCGSAHVKRNGTVNQKHQRWLCNSCDRSFVWRNKTNKHLRHFVWFKQWLVEG
ncbi:MAG: IS1 family transposase, partial [Ignavibacteriales bacterium]|nr:IS1 family transposase [Ignavibacteriales bacterium]